MIFAKNHFRIYDIINLFVNKFIVNENNELMNKDKNIDRI